MVKTGSGHKNYYYLTCTPQYQCTPEHGSAVGCDMAAHALHARKLAQRENSNLLYRPLPLSAGNVQLPSTAQRLMVQSHAV